LARSHALPVSLVLRLTLRGRGTAVLENRRRHTLHLPRPHALTVMLILLSPLGRRRTAILRHDNIHALHLPRPHALSMSLVLLLLLLLRVLKLLLLTKTLRLLLDSLPDLLRRHDRLARVGVGLELGVHGAAAAVVRRPYQGLLLQ